MNSNNGRIKKNNDRCFKSAALIIHNNFQFWYLAALYYKLWFVSKFLNFKILYDSFQEI